MQQERIEPRLSYLNIIVIILSIYVLAAIVVSSFVDLEEEVAEVINIVDNIVCIVFLIEFIVRFSRAESKWKFMKWGWIDLLSSIPYVDFFRAGRAVRLFRLLRIIRAFRSARHLIDHIFLKRTQGAFATVSVLAILMIIFSAIAILQVEDAPNSNIKTAEDAIWWAYVTITTVGYGDLFPVTTEGRIIAALLMTTGVGMFGTFTGFLASWFVSDKTTPDHNNKLMKN
jgi:voltage-gated potassium channel